MIRIILADDHSIIRGGLRSLLSAEPDLEVVGEASHGQELLELLPTTPADVVLMDLNMPVLDGFHTMPLLREQFPQVKVVVLSMLEHEKYVSQLFAMGARGYLLKNARIREIAHALRMVAEGQTFLCSELALAFLDKASQTNVTTVMGTGPRGAELSNRELEVLRLIAEGLTNAEIADKLFTSKRTIETHRQNIIEKTQAKNTAALIKYAMNEGIIK
ncbi:response regulator transcription factor [Hymenobacter sp. BT175]|uniref:response regulator n=1 Tax=Hymenobacter translucens TaxID=2886507 RepID=UPI001D0F1FD8|nr:response regulator transcription factor [Hymenobacter translucens]MCC2547303.1 response regulator transcription factor [Hymenobacter translucens]